MGRFKIFLLGLQHVFVMAGATILVPMLTGLPVSLALFTSGLGTLIFHIITKRKVPVYLGSSFAYIGGIIVAVGAYYASSGDMSVALAYATGGIMVAGLVKIVFGFFIKFIGANHVLKLFPTYLYGTMILLIGLILAPTAITMASTNWLLAIVAMGIVIFISLFTKGFISTFPILLGLFVTYIIAILTSSVDIAHMFTGVKIFSLPPFILPRFGWFAISAIVPAAFVATVEHIGDIYAVGAIVRKDFTKDPGLHRTLIGDGLATSVAGFLGGPANTTYSENTGVLALTKQYNPLIMEVAAVIAIIISFIPAVDIFLSSIPPAIMGGVSILLFGFIASIGIKSMVHNRVILGTKEIIVMAVMLCLSIGGATLTTGNFMLSGLGLSAIVGIILNLILVKK